MQRCCLRSPAAVMFFSALLPALRAAGPLPGEPGLRSHRGTGQARAKASHRQAAAVTRKDQSLATKLSYARPAEAKAIALADEVALLARWLRDDILSVAGPEYAIRRDLLDFVVAEFRPRVRPVRIGSGR